MLGQLREGNGVDGGGGGGTEGWEEVRVGFIRSRGSHMVDTPSMWKGAPVF